MLRDAMPLALAMYQPDIPQNCGAMLRLCACLGVEAHVIEPAGFAIADARFRRAGMDYLNAVALVRHASWRAFEDARRAQGRRVALLTTRGDTPYARWRFEPDDILMVGRESAGAPSEVHDAADARLVIPLQAGLRSLNVALAAAMALGEARRQLETADAPSLQTVSA